MSSARACVFESICVLFLQKSRKEAEMVQDAEGIMAHPQLGDVQVQ